VSDEERLQDRQSRGGRTLCCVQQQLTQVSTAQALALTAIHEPEMRGQWLHQLPVPSHGPQTAEARAAHRLRRRASEVWPACASLAPDFAPQARCRFNRRYLCVFHNVTTRLRPELFLPDGDDVGVFVAGSVVDRSSSDCTAGDRNVPRSQFPYGISSSS
jgi:hypothetical protein